MCVIVGRVYWSGLGGDVWVGRVEGVPRLGRAVRAGVCSADRSTSGDLGQVVVG